jgi:toxin FitB
MYLLDTNILAELTKRQQDSGIVEFVSGLNSVTISVITIHEIAFGVERADPEKKAKLALWFERFKATGPEVLPVDQGIAQRSGATRADSEARGRQMSMADAIIAATAQLHNLVLVTRNTKDFEFCNISLLNPFST